MSLNESIVEDAALEWFLLRQGFGGHVGELVPRLREVGHGPHRAPGEPAVERDSFGEVVLAGCLRAAIRRLSFSIREEASACAWAADRRATHKEFLSVPRHMETRLNR